MSNHYHDPCKKVIWYEGMPLLPQHFQSLDKYIVSLNVKAMSICRPSLHGLIDLEWKFDDLISPFPSIERCEGFFLNGEYFYIHSLSLIDEEIQEVNHEKSYYLQIHKIQTNSQFSSSFEGNVTHDILDEILVYDTHELPSYHQSQAKKIFISYPRYKMTLSEFSESFDALIIAKINFDLANNRWVICKQFIPPFYNLLKSHTFKSYLLAIYRKTQEKIQAMKLIKNNNTPNVVSVLHQLILHSDSLLWIIHSGYCDSREITKLLSEMICNLNYLYEEEKIEPYKNPIYSDKRINEIHLIEKTIEILDRPLSRRAKKVACLYRENDIWESEADVQPLSDEKLVYLEILNNDDLVSANLESEIICESSGQIDQYISRGVPGFLIQKFDEELPIEIDKKIGAQYYLIHLSNRNFKDKISIYSKRIQLKSKLLIWQIS